MASLRSQQHAEHERQLSEDISGNVAKNGSSCWLRLLEEEKEEETDDDTGDEEDGDDAHDHEGDNTIIGSVPVPSVTYENPNEYFRKEVVLSKGERTELAMAMKDQVLSPIWHSERRKRITSTMAKSVACRKKEDVSALLQAKTASSFSGSKAIRYGTANEKNCSGRIQWLP